jgi:hypothetical protein
MKIEDVISLREYITLKEHTPGRAVLSMSPKVMSHPAARSLGTLASVKSRPEAGLILAKLNIMTKSLELDYDTNIITEQDLDTYLNGQDMAQVEQAAVKVAALLNIPLDA